MLANFGENCSVLVQRYKKNASNEIHCACYCREVTGFILFFRVFNLITLRDMFPNLMMIRGQKLIGNYALIFYDLRDFHEVGIKPTGNLFRC